MKKIIYLLTIVVLSTLTSCSNDDGVTTSEELSLFKNGKINTFLNNYYETDYSKGESVISESNNFKITSLLSNSQVSPIGYVRTDLKTKEFITFYDINFNSETLTIHDFMNDKVFVQEHFFTKNNIKKSDGFDIISLTNENNLVQQKRFWGTECHAGSCSTCIECCYHAFWFAISCSEFNYAM